MSHKNPIRTGVLHKGFTINTGTMQFQIPRGQKVVFAVKQREILFPGHKVVLFESGHQWYARIYGYSYQMIFDKETPPYPISYYG